MASDLIALLMEDHVVDDRLVGEGLSDTMSETDEQATGWASAAQQDIELEAPDSEDLLARSQQQAAPQTSGPSPSIEYETLGQQRELPLGDARQAQSRHQQLTPQQPQLSQLGYASQRPPLPEHALQLGSQPREREWRRAPYRMALPHQLSDSLDDGRSATPICAGPEAPAPANVSSGTLEHKFTSFVSAMRQQEADHLERDARLRRAVDEHAHKLDETNKRMRKLEDLANTLRIRMDQLELAIFNPNRQPACLAPLQPPQPESSVAEPQQMATLVNQMRAELDVSRHIEISRLDSRFSQLDTRLSNLECSFANDQESTLAVLTEILNELQGKEDATAPPPRRPMTPQSQLRVRSSRQQLNRATGDRGVAGWRR